MECLRCHREFASKQSLDYHTRKAVCLKKSPNTTCKDCKKVFSSRQNLEYHTEKKVCKRKVVAAKKCDNCSKAFSSSQRLRYHIEHAVCKDQKCPLCDLKYSDPWHKNRCDEYVDWGCDGEMPFYRIKAHVQTKKELDALCYNFDKKEGRPWSDYLYWRKRCKECGHGRFSEGHMGCLNRRYE